jgi:lysophospholipase L1-like esterase
MGLKGQGLAKMKDGLKRGIAGVLISGIVTAAILEAAIRIFQLIPDDTPVPYRQLAGEEDFGPEPNQSARSLYGTLYRTDSRGLRGLERTLVRSAERVRIAVLGDSVVWGVGINEEVTIPGWLERLAGPGLEAWNLGVPANNPYNEKARYARLAPLIRPDVTIVLLLYNDLETAADRVRITSARTISNPARRAPYPDSWRPILEKSALFQALIRIYTNVTRTEDKVFSLAYLPGILAQLDAIRGTANNVGSSLIIAAMPGVWPDPGRFAGLSDGLKRYCAERQIAFVDLSSVLGSPVRREYFLPADFTHPTAEGARLIAEALLPQALALLQRPR